MVQNCIFCGKFQDQNRLLFLSDSIDKFENLMETSEIDINKIKHSSVCTKCDGLICSFFEFKSSFMDKEDNLLNYVKSEKKVDLREVLVKEGQLKKSKDFEHVKVCRTCFKTIKQAGFKEIRSYDSGLAEVVSTCLPDFDIFLTTKTFICLDCHQTLRKYYLFVLSCLNALKDLKKHTDNKDPLELKGKSTQPELSTSTQPLLVPQKRKPGRPRKIPGEPKPKNRRLKKSLLPPQVKVTPVQPAVNPPLPPKKIEYTNPKEIYKVLNAKDSDKHNYSFECQVCPASFESHDAILKHLQFHESPAEYKCWKCELPCQSMIVLSRHFTNAHDLGVFKVVLDNNLDGDGQGGSEPIRFMEWRKKNSKKVSRKPDNFLSEAFKNYMPEDIEEGEKIECQLCLDRLSSVASFGDHLNKLHSKLRCERCKYVCASLVGLKSHLTQWHKSSDLYEILPPKRKPATLESSISKPSKTQEEAESATEPIRCNSCSQNFNSLTDHINHTCSKSSEYCCGHCSGVFYNLDDLDDHTCTAPPSKSSTVHPNETIEKTNKKLSAPSSVATAPPAPFVEEEEDADYECSFCNSAFITLKALDNHDCAGDADELPPEPSAAEEVASPSSGTTNHPKSLYQDPLDCTTSTTSDSTTKTLSISGSSTNVDKDKVTYLNGEPVATSITTGDQFQCFFCHAVFESYAHCSVHTCNQPVSSGGGTIAIEDDTTMTSNKVRQATVRRATINAAKDRSCVVTSSSSVKVSSKATTTLKKGVIPSRSLSLVKDALSNNKAAIKTNAAVECYRCQSVFTSLSEIAEHKCSSSVRFDTDNTEHFIAGDKGIIAKQANMELVQFPVKTEKEFECAHCLTEFETLSEMEKHSCNRITASSSLTSGSIDLLFKTEPCYDDYNTGQVKNTTLDKTTPNLAIDKSTRNAQMPLDMLENEELKIEEGLSTETAENIKDSYMTEHANGSKIKDVNKEKPENVNTTEDEKVPVKAKLTKKEAITNIARMFGVKIVEGADKGEQEQSSKKEFDCVGCDFRTFGKKDWFIHVNYCEHVKQCPHCSFRTNVSQQLEYHCYNAHDVVLFVCHRCRFATSMDENYESHMKMHGEDFSWEKQEEAIIERTSSNQKNTVITVIEDDDDDLSTIEDVTPARHKQNETALGRSILSRALLGQISGTSSGIVLEDSVEKNTNDSGKNGEKESADIMNISDDEDSDGSNMAGPSSMTLEDEDPLSIEPLPNAETSNIEETESAVGMLLVDPLAIGRKPAEQNTDEFIATVNNDIDDSASKVQNINSLDATTATGSEPDKSAVNNNSENFNAVQAVVGTSGLVVDDKDKQQDNNVRPFLPVDTDDDVINIDSDSDTEFVEESTESRIANASSIVKEICSVDSAEASRLISQGVPVVTESSLSGMQMMQSLSPDTAEAETCDSDLQPNEETNLNVASASDNENVDDRNAQNVAENVVISGKDIDAEKTSVDHQSNSSRLLDEGNSRDSEGSSIFVTDNDDDSLGGHEDVLQGETVSNTSEEPVVLNKYIAISTPLLCEPENINTFDSEKTSGTVNTSSSSSSVDAKQPSEGQNTLAKRKQPPNALKIATKKVKIVLRVPKSVSLPRLNNSPFAMNPGDSFVISDDDDNDVSNDMSGTGDNSSSIDDEHVPSGSSGVVDQMPQSTSTEATTSSELEAKVKKKGTRRTNLNPSTLKAVVRDNCVIISDDGSNDLLLAQNQLDKSSDGAVGSSQMANRDSEDDCVVVADKSDTKSLENSGGTERLSSPTANSLMKRPMNSFLLFCNKIKSEISKKYPLLKAKDQRAIVLHSWRSMTDEEKWPFVEEARIHRLLFKREHPEVCLRQPRKHSKPQQKVVDKNQCTTTDDAIDDVMFVLEKPSSECVRKKIQDPPEFVIKEVKDQSEYVIELENQPQRVIDEIVLD